LSTLRVCCVSGKSEPIKPVFSFAAGGRSAGGTCTIPVSFFFLKFNSTLIYDRANFNRLLHTNASLGSIH
jgi:hypothetical protein